MEAQGSYRGKELLSPCHVQVIVFLSLRVLWAPASFILLIESWLLHFHTASFSSLGHHSELSQGKAGEAWLQYLPGAKLHYGPPCTEGPQHLLGEAGRGCFSGQPSVAAGGMAFSGNSFFAGSGWVRAQSRGCRDVWCLKHTLLLLSCLLYCCWNFV